MSVSNDENPRQEDPPSASCNPLQPQPAEQVSKIVPGLVAAAFFMQMLDGTVLNTALPNIAASIGESPLSMQSVVISYLITVAILIPASGWLADRFGVKKMFFAAIVIFCVGSLMCALSYSLTGLVISRVVQGIGGAVMAPVGRLAILRITPRQDFVRVMSFITIPGLIGPLLGPIVGGLLVEYASWHWIFLINIPVGLVGCVLTLRYMPSLCLPGTKRFDWFGFLVFGFSTVALSMAVEGAGELHFTPGLYTALFVCGLAGLLTYCLYARKSSHPIFPLSMFKTRTFSVGIAGNFFARLGAGAMPFLMPLFLQLGLGMNPAKAGLTLLPMALGGMMAKAFVSRMVDRMGFRKVLVTNTVCQGAVMMSVALVPEAPNYCLLLFHLGLLGVINSIQFSVMNTVTLLDLPKEAASGGNSILSVVMQLSTSFGVAVGAMFLSFFLSGLDLHHTPGPQLLPAFHLSFLCIGGWVILTCLIFAFMPGQHGKKSKKKARQIAAPH